MERDIRDGLAAVGKKTQIVGDLLEARPHGRGHINDTFLAVYQTDSGRVRYIHQRINPFVFKDPEAVMENVDQVTRHLRRKLELSGIDDVDRRVLTLVRTVEGRPFCRDDEGQYWRTYLFIKGTHTADGVDSPDQARETARAFGSFQKLLADLPPHLLHETIPDFHNTPKRLQALREAIGRDRCHRVREVSAEISFFERESAIVFGLERLQETGDLPLRIVHNDAKINNLLIDEGTGEGICVVDLDTVMPGLALHDFGDLVRTAVCPAAEDEGDLDRVEVRIPIFEALVEGYLSSAGEFLNATERDNLTLAAQIITFENAMRFLTDFLSGDPYFKIRRPRHNLDRCRNQLKLFRSLKDHQEALRRVVRGTMLTRPTAP